MMRKEPGRWVSKTNVGLLIGFSLGFLGMGSLESQGGQEAIEVPLEAISGPRILVNVTPLAGDESSDETGQPRGQCPPETVTHSSASFEVGVPQPFVIQQGIVATEIAAVSFLLPADKFPVVFRTAEIVWATSGAQFATTVPYTLLIWQGNPNSGAQVDSFQSDGTIIPHIQMPIGSNAIIHGLTVDPTDPEQVVIQDNGSHIFSVGFRIDAMNAPSQTTCPCIPSLPSFGSYPAVCCPGQLINNSFPTTDGMNALSQPTRNWLFARNCPGATGLCSPNGGWFNFQTSGMPTGDWNIRVTYEPFTCELERACCNPTTGVCTGPMTQAACQASGNTWMAGSASCSPNPCPQPTGACCKFDGCQVLTNQQCNSQGGVYQGNSVPCGQTPCPEFDGTCCLADGSCLSLSSTGCAENCGTFTPSANPCSTTCPDARGGCCLDSPVICVQVNSCQCTSLGGSFQGIGVNCAAGDTCPTGRCCLPNGQCQVMRPLDCQGMSGTYAGTGTVCPEPNPCPQPTGRCCAASGTCTPGLTQATCQATGGTWALGGCSPNPCPQPTGRCCDPGTGSCTPGLTLAGCQAISGTWTQGGTCTPNPCPPPTGRCCSASGTCTPGLTQSLCQATGGTWALGGCTPNPCAPTGRCCDPNSGTCTPGMTQTACQGTGGSWTQGGVCSPNPCPQPCSSHSGDMDGNGVKDSRDVVMWVNLALGTPTAAQVCAGDFNGGGSLEQGDIPGFVSAILNGP